MFGCLCNSLRLIPIILLSKIRAYSPASLFHNKIPFSGKPQCQDLIVSTVLYTHGAFISITAHTVWQQHSHLCKANTQAPLKYISLENERQPYFHHQIPAYDLFVLLWGHLSLLLTNSCQGRLREGSSQYPWFLELCADKDELHAHLNLIVQISSDISTRGIISSFQPPCLDFVRKLRKLSFHGN